MTQLGAISLPPHLPEPRTKEGIYTQFLSLWVTKPREMMVTTEPSLLPVTRVGFFTDRRRSQPAWLWEQRSVWLQGHQIPFVETAASMFDLEVHERSQYVEH